MGPEEMIQLFNVLRTLSNSLNICTYEIWFEDVFHKNLKSLIMHSNFWLNDHQVFRVFLLFLNCT